LTASQSIDIEIGENQSFVNTGNYSLTVYQRQGSKETTTLKPRGAWQTPSSLEEKKLYRLSVKAGTSGGQITVFNGRIFPESYYIAHPELKIPLPGYEPVILFVDGVLGDDTNAGTYSDPLKTVTKALSVTPNIIIVLDGLLGETITIAQSDLYLAVLNASPQNWEITIDLSVDRYNLILDFNNIDHQNLAGAKPILTYSGTKKVYDSKITFKKLRQYDNTHTIKLRAVGTDIVFEQLEDYSFSGANAIGIELLASEMSRITGDIIRGFDGTNARGIVVNASAYIPIRGENVIDVKAFYGSKIGISTPNATSVLFPTFYDCETDISGASVVLVDGKGTPKYNTIDNLNTNVETDLIPEVTNPKISEISGFFVDYVSWLLDASIVGSLATLTIKYYQDDYGGTLREMVNMREVITEGATPTGQLEISGPGRFCGNYKITVQSSIAPTGGAGSNLVKVVYVKG
jgi:hypothetical protein